MIEDLVNQAARAVGFSRQTALFRSIYRKYRDFTMLKEGGYISNLGLANQMRDVNGAVVECGVWRGGMIAGLADLLGPNREYVLCDSFEGLPPAADIDGEKAKAYQADKTDPMYHDNCTAGEEFARRAMAQSPATRVRYVKGWFNETLPTLELSEPIALLRIDGDWYDSTMACLSNLYPKVASGGIVVLDDYHVWDGCSRAVHDYLSAKGSTARIRQWDHLVCYMRLDHNRR